LKLKKTNCGRIEERANFTSGCKQRVLVYSAHEETLRVNILWWRHDIFRSSGESTHLMPRNITWEAFWYENNTRAKWNNNHNNNNNTNNNNNHKSIYYLLILIFHIDISYDWCRIWLSRESLSLSLSLYIYIYIYIYMSLSLSPSPPTHI